ncbi:23S rRNA (adenine(1618)-N(6))-methyltransferase RlmF [Advenella kashmirensis]
MSTLSLFHPRNRHQGRYDFTELIKSMPELGAFVRANPHGDQSIDFANRAAVQALNAALLKTWYGVSHWDIPEGYLCPPIPGRGDYVHHLADLLAECNAGVIPRGPAVHVLDIGTGASAIYPIIGHFDYGWRFTGSDIDPGAVKSAQAIIQANPGIRGAAEVRRQKSPAHIFKGLVGVNDRFDLTLCNPPFYSSSEDAANNSERKWRGLGRAGAGHKRPLLNFGGRDTELWCKGGEVLFINRMAEESTTVQKQVLWFSTLVSKESNLPEVYRSIKNAGALHVRTVDMTQGQKKSRFVAWTFLNRADQKAWHSRREANAIRNG